MGIVGNDVAPIFQIFANYDLYNSRSKFTFVRLMNGTWVEPTFSQVWNNIHTRKAPYLNLKPLQSIPDQVNKFFDQVMLLAPDFSLPPVFDTENLLLTQGMISQAWSIGYQKFGNYPMPYSSKYFWLKAYPDYPSVPRWVANYPNSLVGLRYDEQMVMKIEMARLAGFPAMPEDWGIFREPGDFWQCSETGYGPDWGLKWPESKAIDVDYFDGTEQDLADLMDKWSGTFVPPPPETKTGKAITAANFRPYPVPMTGCNIYRLLVVGEILTILGERNGFCGHDWWSVKDSIGIVGWCIKSAVQIL